MNQPTPLESFRTKVVVITGASAGIGSGFARQAAALGMRLVLADIAAARLEASAVELRESGTEVEAVATDVSDPASVEALAERALARFGEVDEQVATGRYWVTALPDMIDQGVVPRAEMIRDRIDPVLDLGM